MELSINIATATAYWVAENEINKKVEDRGALEGQTLSRELNKLVDQRNSARE